MGNHRDLGAVSRLTSNDSDFDITIDELWYFELEQGPDELGMTAADHYLRPLPFTAHRQYVGLDPVAALQSVRKGYAPRTALLLQHRRDRE